jgi:hypothetical protein
MIKFTITDGPWVKGFDSIVKMLVAGATLPTKPLPKPTPAELVARSPVNEALVEAFMDLTRLQNADSLEFATGLSMERCVEIMEIRDKLLDIPE